MQNLQGFRNVLKDNPDSLEALLSKYQVPFQIVEPPTDGSSSKGEKPFLSCQYNRFGEKQHRSPWTNQLHPKDDAEDDDAMNEDDDESRDNEDDELRLLEITTNEVWDSYKNLYYGHEAVGSVYLKESTDGGAFQGLFGVYKKSPSLGSSWQSVSLVHVGQPGEETCSYRVHTTAFVIIEEESSGDDDVGLNFNVSAMVSKEVSKECKITPGLLTASHIGNLGDLIEANEMDLRSQLERVQIPKTIETVDAMLKKKEKSFKPSVNPLMGMIMDSEMLKKKMADEAAGELPSTLEKVDTMIKKKEAIKAPVNPLMGMIMDSDVLKKKRAKEAAGE